MAAAPHPAPLAPAELKSTVEAGYDAIAPIYLAWSAPRPTTTRAGYVAQLLSLLSPGASVLELGCGAGVPTTQTIAAHEKRLRVTGVDISAAQVALAREHVQAPKGDGDEGRIAFVHADMAKLEYAEGSFDAVLAFYSIFHLPREEQAPMVGQMAGWLRPGGYLLLNMQTEEGEFMREDWMGARMFSSGIGVDANRRAFAEHGKGLKILADEIATEKVGPFEEKFHWVFAVKE
ncbi:S-adenosyl-L-methionine-dependent methyltransferase [Ganoderma leucocontextum]|nr:S-adenosyl-L-methionine-dependent methyltransferase [Ganoderma leucocontextum]